MKKLKEYGVEFRRGSAGGGNQLRQPYLKKYKNKIKSKNFKNVEKVHFFGYYIGNYPSLKKKNLNILINKLNKFKYD